MPPARLSFVRTLVASAGPSVNFLVFEVSAACLLSVNSAGELVSWDLNTFGVRFQLSLQARVTSVCLAASSPHLYIGTAEGDVIVVNSEKGYISSYTIELADVQPLQQSSSMPSLDYAVVAVIASLPAMLLIGYSRGAWPFAAAL